MSHCSNAVQEASASSKAHDEGELATEGLLPAKDAFASGDEDLTWVHGDNMGQQRLCSAYLPDLYCHGPPYTEQTPSDDCCAAALRRPAKPQRFRFAAVDLST